MSSSARHPKRDVEELKLNETKPTLDALIIGAGPAGLAAAHGLLRTAPNSRVLIVDGGNDLEDRLQAPDSATRYRTPSEPTIGEQNSDLVEGVGGAGLFSDGKLCLSLDVGGDLPTKVAEAKRSWLLEQVKLLFHADQYYPVQAETALPDWMPDLGSLSSVSYPVAHIGTDRTAFRIAELRRTLRTLGATIRPRTSLVSVTPSRLGFRVALRTNQRTNHWNRPFTVSTRALILCLGKVGADQQRQICADLGIDATPLPMYVGVRLETDSRFVSHLFKPGEDAKLKLTFDDGSKIKTHCVAAGGAVLPLSYSGLLLAGGHSKSISSGTRSSVSLLWNGIKVQSDSVALARSIMADVSRQANGKLLVQRLQDYRLLRPSTRNSIASCSPTTDIWTAGNISNVMPPAYLTRMDDFLLHLQRLAPELDSGRTILFAPSIEWWSSRVPTDENMQTTRDGLFVAGDGAGWSQGIVHAAATGLLAGEGAQTYLARANVRHALRVG